MGACQLHPAGAHPHGSCCTRSGFARDQQDYASCTPLPRVGEVEDIANAAVFLLSDAAGWITGQVINVDGGHGLRRGPDMTAMLEPVFGADGLRGVVPS